MFSKHIVAPNGTRECCVIVLGWRIEILRWFVNGLNGILKLKVDGYKPRRGPACPKYAISIYAYKYALRCINKFPPLSQRLLSLGLRLDACAWNPGQNFRPQCTYSGYSILSLLFSNAKDSDVDVVTYHRRSRSNHQWLLTDMKLGARVAPVHAIHYKP